MRKTNWEHLLGGKSGLILIGTLILITIVIVLSYIWQTQHTFKVPLNDINWTHIIIHIVASFLIGLIALFLLRLSEAKRRRMVEMLQEEKDRAQNYLDIADVILVAIDAEQKVFLINKKGCEFLGYKEEEIIGKNWFENFLPEGVRGKVIGIFEKLISGEIESVEYVEGVVLTRSGQEKIITWHNTVLKDEAGKIIGTLSSGEDITERKKAEEALKESEKRFKDVVESAGEWIWEINVNGLYTYASPVIEKVLGFKPEEVVGKKYFYDFFAPEVRDELKKAAFEVFARKESFTKFVNPNIHRNSNRVILETSGVPILDEKGTLLGYRGADTDITERKQVEETLRASESKYRTLLENLPQKIFFKDKNLVYVSCNENYAWDLKILPNEITGKTDYDFFPKALAEKYRADDKRIMQTGKTEDLEEEYLQEGQAIFVHTVKTPIKDEKGNIIGVLGIFWDITERKRAEEKLLEEKYFSDSIINGLPGVFYTFDDKDRFLRCNENFEKVSGYSAEEIKKMNPTDLFEGEEKKIIAERIQEVLTKGVTAVEANFVPKSGEKIPYYFTGLRIRIGDATIVVGTGTDISERKKAEEALRTSEAQLSNAIKIAKLGYWEYDVAKDLFTFNDHFYAIFRTSAEQVGSYTIPSARYAQLFVHPDDMAVVGNEIRKALESTDPHYSRQLEHRIIYADGENGYITVRFFTIKDSQGRTVRTYGANQDITERKRTEEALRESEEKYRLLIENQGEGIITADLEENFTFANPSAEKIFGVPKGGLVGRNLKDFTSSEQFKFIREQTKRRHKNEKDSYEIEIINAKEGKRFLLLTAAPWFDKDGVLTATFGIFRDVTERKQLQQQLIQTEKLASVGTLAYGIAHEFNNILAGMLANAELGLITDEPKQIEECFNIIAENSYRASSITRNLLAFSHNKEAKKELIDVTEPLRSVLAITRRELEKLNIQIVENFKPLPKICCDAGQLSEVFLNMITNARDAMRDKGGKLVIQVEPVEENIQIIFQDTGCGIPEKIKGKIYEPFVTTKGALGKSDIPGTGLGLFLSYGIIDGYKGKIEVESGVGKGTRFTISIPVSKNLPYESIRDTEIESSGESKMKLKILLVDDEKAISFGLKKFLESRGHKVRAFLKAKEGLEHIRKERFDLVLSDIALPDMDGIELIKMVKEKNKYTKVIAITGHILRQKEEQARKAGADEVLIKPFKNEVLCSTISRLINRPQINNKSFSE